MTRNRRASAADQEIEVAALVGLQHVIDVEALVAAAPAVVGSGQFRQARGQFLVADVQVQAALFAVQLDEVAVAHGGQRAACRGLGRHVQHHGAVGGAAHAGVGDADHVLHALPQQLRRQAHVAHLGHAGVALGAAVLHDHHAARVDVQVLIDDARLVVLQVLEHHGPAPVLEQLGRGGRGLEHRAARRQVAAQDADAAIRDQRVVQRADHLVVVLGRVAHVVPQAPAVHGERFRVGQQAVLAQAAQHGGQAARVVELFHQEAARGLQVHQGGRAAPDAGPVLQVELHADAAGDRLQVDDGIGRAADGGIGADGVLEGFSRQDLREREPFVRHLDDAPARHVRQHVAARVHRRDRRVVRQRGAQRFGHAGHRAGRAHGVAGAGRARHAAFGREELVQLDLARLQGFVQLPDGRARSDVLAGQLAVEHGPARDHDGRHVAAGRAHQQRGRGLVAAGQQDDGVDGVAADGFLHVHAGQVAREHGGGAQVGFAVGEHGEFHREAARLVDAALDVLGDLEEVRVAGREFGPGVADADDGAAVELMVGDALVLHPAAVHEAVLVGRAEPFGGAEFARRGGHRGGSRGMRETESEKGGGGFSGAGRSGA